MPNPASTSLRWDISGIREAVRAEKITPHAILQEHRQVIRSLNDTYRAISTEVRPPAHESDASLPLAGVPILIKDDIVTHGIETNAGSLALKGWIPDVDAAPVRKLTAAGAVIIGKTGLSEWAGGRSPHELRGWSATNGQVRNAHDVNRSPGGSSAGSAVGVALGMGVAALGSETVGSVVLPAAMNGIVGLKPTMGLVDSSGLLPLSGEFSQSTIGPMARTVADVAQVLSIIGEFGVDATTATCLEDIDRFLDEPTGHFSPEQWRIGVWKDPTLSAVGPARMLHHAEQLAQVMGVHVVRDITVQPSEDYLTLMGKTLEYEFAWAFDSFLQSLPRSFPNSLAELIDFNQQNSDAELSLFGQEWFHDRQSIVRQGRNEEEQSSIRNQSLGIATGALEGALAAHDLDALMTITTIPPWLIDPIVGDPVAPDTVTLACVSGFPHITVPGLRYQGLPIGVSLIGRPYSDGKLLSLAAAFESQLGAKLPR